MKTFAYMTLVSIWLILLHSCAVPNDEEGDDRATGDDVATASLPWEGEINKFIINSKEGIRLNDTEPTSGIAYATFPSSHTTNIRWEFGVRLTFNPSAKNYARFYLYSSSTKLIHPLHGYFIQIGGAKDNVGLYTQIEREAQLLISGRELMKGNNAPQIRIKVECDANGNWTLWTRLESDSEYTLEGYAYNCSPWESNCAGIFCHYTPTRSKGISFHHIQISHPVTNAPVPDNPAPTPPKELPNKVRGMILFNEVMYDCSKLGEEYIELYNPSPFLITCPSLRLVRYIDISPNGTQTEASVILRANNGEQQISIPPYGYLCLTRSVNRLKNIHPDDCGNIIEVPNLPVLTNTSSHLALMTNEAQARVIDTCSYMEEMHSNSDARHQGISLEKINPNYPSSYQANWSSSQSASGGTPGKANSLLRTPQL